MDAVIALAALGMRTGLRASGAVVGAIRPLSRAVDTLCADRGYVRELAETGARYRRAAAATVTRHYLAAVHTVANDVVDQLDVPRLVREYRGALVSDTRRGIRTQAAEGDGRVSRWFDSSRRRADH
jgi:hypothetical protein